MSKETKALMLFGIAGALAILLSDTTEKDTQPSEVSSKNPNEEKPQPKKSFVFVVSSNGKNYGAFKNHNDALAFAFKIKFTLEANIKIEEIELK